MADVTVKTLSGPVSGVQENNVVYFKGVPFAKPPVGKLRWQAPEDPEPWTETRRCDTYAPMAPQMMVTGGWWGPEFYYDWFDKSAPMSEDCLYLNIVCPADAEVGANLPVLLWWHGGAYLHGYTYEPEFESSKLAAKGLIVVTAAYRLGLFGYLATPELSAASPTGTSGNYALLDQIKSIEWVRKNIAAFGGDPGSITIGGQSAGAGAVTHIITSPLAKGLFKRAVLNSSFGALGTLGSKDDAYRGSKEYLAKKAYDKLSAEELRALPLTAFLNENTSISEFDDRCFRPCLDGYVLTKNQKDYYFKEGSLNGIDLLFGSNSGEANSSFKISAAEEINVAAQKNFGSLYDKYHFEKLYHGGDDIGATFESLRLHSEMGAVQHLLIAETLARLNPGSKIFSYYFTHWTPGRESEIRWAWHSAELWYCFNSLRPIPHQRDWRPLDYKIADDFSSYWVNFMKSGNPNGGALPHWPQFSEKGGALMELGDIFHPITNLYEGTKLAARDDFMREYVRGKL